MAVGNFGTIRPSDISIDNIEVFYSYSTNRETISNQFFPLNSAEVLEEITDPDDSINPIGGLYNLTLPSGTFNELGIYNIYIRPKQIRTTLADCGVLSALPNIKGIVLDTTNPQFTQNPSLIQNNALTGYRIEYYNSDGTKRRNFFRIVTSSNRAEPVTENVNNTSQKSIRYRFNDSGSLLFLTVTPSSAPNVKPNSTPFIGEPNQEIIISNTGFDPIMIEVELVEHNFETLAIGLFGNQARDVENGIVTYYDENNEIYKQFNVFQIRDDFNNPLYEVKEERDSIDETQDFDTITDDV
ncbi:MAG: hypothetical protein ACOC33_00305 [bacterium]